MEAELRRVSMATCDELLGALVARHQEAGRVEKGRILTEFAAVTGYHRKHAARWLARDDAARSVTAPARAACVRRGGARGADRGSWGASDRICGPSG